MKIRSHAPAALDLGDRIERQVVERFGDGAENFVPPSDGEMAALRSVVADARHATSAADRERVRREADPLGYALDVLPHGYLMLLEKDEAARGWGTVILDPASASDVVIEVPHPGFDHGTPELGWKAFQAFGAGALVIAGATRGNRHEASPEVSTVRPDGFDPWRHAPGVPDYSISDPTHARGTAFQAAHQALTGPTAVVLQIHGFSAWKHHQQDPAFPADEQAVLTDCADDRYDPPHLVAAQAALQGAGFRSRLVTFADAASSALGATPNVQHRDMDERGLVGRGHAAEFTHLELDRSLRTGPQRDEQLDAVVRALQPVFGTSRA